MDLIAAWPWLRALAGLIVLLGLLALWWWLSRRRQFERGIQQLVMPRWRLLLWITGGFLLVFIFVLNWESYKEKETREAIAPLLTLAAGLVVAGVALMRHFAATDADRQRRITESYSKAVEQLSSDKIEQRLGGIYTLERISRESENDYWTIMETLTAFVRERTRGQRPAAESAEVTDNGPQTDIAAVLTVIHRRSQKMREREKREGWRLDLREANLFGASLHGADLTNAVLIGANLTRAHLIRANLTRAYLHGANLTHADLTRAYLNHAILHAADLSRAYLTDADLMGVDLTDADLTGTWLNNAALRGTGLAGAKLIDANLRGAGLRGATLRGANLTDAALMGADLTDADLSGATVTQEQLDQACGTDVKLDSPLSIKPYPDP